MFENLLHQSASDLLTEDIKQDKLPGSLLFAGPAASGKLTCALELARVLSCSGEDKGRWICRCPSCLQHKALISPNVLVTGPGNRTLEIAAARNTLLAQAANDTNHVNASRYLYLRAVRKLTVRFSPILWEGDDKLSKFSPVIEEIENKLEELNPARTLPDSDKLQECLDDIQKQCQKLEDSFLYDALPVSQVRNLSLWAKMSSEQGKKVIIIENADKMADSARNALLKILEEPPENTMFILTTTKRGAMLPTILSRVRTYNFYERPLEQQQEVISKVFHYDPTLTQKPMPSSIDSFMQTFLPVTPDVITDYAAQFFKTCAEGHVADVVKTVNGCNGFAPRILYMIFIQGIVDAQKKLINSAAGANASALILNELRRSYNNVTVFNQNPASALEELSRSLLQINHNYDGILKEAL